MAPFLKNLSLHGTDIQGIENYVVKELVNCITFDSLVKKYNVTNINIIQIDTEGYDYEIIKMINFAKVRPDIIILEYLHLTYYEYFAVIDFLRSKNYNVNRNKESMDLLAIDNETL